MCSHIQILAQRYKDSHTKNVAYILRIVLVNFGFYYKSHIPHYKKMLTIGQTWKRKSPIVSSPNYNL